MYRRTRIFVGSFTASAFEAAISLVLAVVQDNHSLQAGALRGELIRVIEGSVSTRVVR